MGVRRAALSPANALLELLAGNRRFVAGEPRHGHHLASALAVSGDQSPFALVLGCVDSRVPVEAVFDQGFGDIFVARSAGQVLDRAVLGSVELAVAELGVPLVMVLGHTRCRAVQAALDTVRTGGALDGERRYLVEQIAPAAAASDDLTVATRQHVRRTADVLRELEAVRQRADVGALAVVGALYHLDSGRVEQLS